MSDDNFSNYPPSITELKSDKTRNGADWKIRDAIIRALREIDNGDFAGKEIFGAVIIGVINENGQCDTRYYQASPNAFAAIGLATDYIAYLAGPND